MAKKEGYNVALFFIKWSEFMKNGNPAYLPKIVIFPVSL
jgi:hypothetical protein